jgi:hydroxymethylglutaryl-CoA lyase
VLPARAYIREVGPRDGFQMEREFLPTKLKVKIIKMLLEADLKMIEVTSFVHPRFVPQLKDAEEVAASLKPMEGALFSALVVNERGAERAVKAGIPEVQLVVSASEAHSIRNVRMTVSESLRQAHSVCRLARREDLKVRGAIAMSFGCPFEGHVPLGSIKKIATEMADMGIKQVTLADTAGLANPRQVKEMLAVLLEKFKEGITWGLHFHDTRGLGLANTLAGLEAGVVLMESSVGGLGGCPFIPGATGNIATEDLVNMLTMMGVKTGINLPKLLKAAREVQKIIGRSLPGRLLNL